MNNKKSLPLILLLVLGVLAVALKRCNSTPAYKPVIPPTVTTVVDSGTVVNTRGLNRNPQQVHYSKHARCRMGCRHIDESEVMEILKNGIVNYRKSELNADECHKKYAVEGVSHDNQRLRIIFAPCRNEMTVVTVIDIGEEWPCDCK